MEINKRAQEIIDEINARLAELDEYKEIGLTPEQVRELKERDTAKEEVDADDEYDMYVCPSCNMAIGIVGDKEDHHFCLNCGQRLRWEERK